MELAKWLLSSDGFGAEPRVSRQTRDLALATRPSPGRAEAPTCPAFPDGRNRRAASRPEQQDRWFSHININGKRVASTDQCFWPALASIAYLPATIAPVGLPSSGLPVGVQIIGLQYSDRTCITFVHLPEQQHHGFVRPNSWD